jgi:mannose-1-phosphate guanylyltransferase
MVYYYDRKFGYVTQGTVSKRTSGFDVRAPTLPIARCPTAKRLQSTTSLTWNSGVHTVKTAHLVE